MEHYESSEKYTEDEHHIAHSPPTKMQTSWLASSHAPLYLKTQLTLCILELEFALGHWGGLNHLILLK